MAQLPIILGLTLAKEIVVAEHTRNLTMVNCFRRLRFPSFPATNERFYVIAAATDGIGEMEFSLTIAGLEAGSEVFEANRKIVFRSPLAETWIVWTVWPSIFPEAGVYQVSMNANNELLAFRSLWVSIEGENDE
jgi:hypothetical protein